MGQAYTPREPETVEVNVVMGAQLRAIVRSALLHVRKKVDEVTQDGMTLQAIDEELVKWPLSVAGEPEDTLPQWLHKRFHTSGSPRYWNELTEEDQLFWEHEAAAVRRAVGRGGFKTSQDEVEISHPIGDLHQAHANSGGEIKGYRQLDLKHTESLGEAIRIAVGAASMTWTNMQGAGVFKPEVALDIATQLEHHVQDRITEGLGLIGQRHQELGDLLHKYYVKQAQPMVSVLQVKTILTGQAKAEEYKSALQVRPDRDPTHGRIDKDIQEKVDEMNPTSLGQRVAMENTLQERRDGRG